MLLTGTSGRNAIPTHGGFNFSEYNIQDHKPGPDPRANFNEQERTHEKYAGRNPLNPPSSTNDKTQTFGLNKAYGWRENTLHGIPTFQTSQVERTSLLVAGYRGGVGEGGANRSQRHGFGQNDPALQHILSQQAIAPPAPSKYGIDPDSYYHSDVGVPMSMNQNLMEHPTHNQFDMNKATRKAGKHHHQHLDVERKPPMMNNSNTGTGVHHTHAIPVFPVVSGFRADRPLMLSDLPAPPQPAIIPQMGPGPLEQTTNRGVFLMA